MLELLGCTIAAEMGDEESLRAAAVPSGAALAEAAFYCWEAVTSEFYSGLRERERQPLPLESSVAFSRQRGKGI